MKIDTKSDTPTTSRRVTPRRFTQNKKISDGGELDSKQNQKKMGQLMDTYEKKVSSTKRTTRYSDKNDSFQVECSPKKRFRRTTLPITKGEKKEKNITNGEDTGPKEQLEPEELDELSDVYEVEKIVNERQKSGKTQYKIRWKGYSYKDDTWEDESSLNCKKLINEYLNYKKKKMNPTNTKQNKGEDEVRDESSLNTKKKKSAKLEEETEVYEVEELVGDRERRGKIQYKVRWKGYGSNNDTWEDESNLNCNELIEKYIAHKNSFGNDASRPENEEWEIQRIIKMKTLKSGKREFLVRWKGFSSKDDTWEPEDILSHTELFTKFLSKEGKK